MITIDIYLKTKHERRLKIITSIPLVLGIILSFIMLFTINSTKIQTSYSRHEIQDKYKAKYSSSSEDFTYYFQLKDLDEDLETDESHYRNKKIGDIVEVKSIEKRTWIGSKTKYSLEWSE